MFFTIGSACPMAATLWKWIPPWSLVWIPPHKSIPAWQKSLFTCCPVSNPSSICPDQLNLRQRVIFLNGRFTGTIGQRWSEELFSLVAMYASRFGSFVCAERNRIGGARKKWESQRPSATLLREVHAALVALEAQRGERGLHQAFHRGPGLGAYWEVAGLDTKPCAGVLVSCILVSTCDITGNGSPPRGENCARTSSSCFAAPGGVARPSIRISLGS